MAQRFFDPRPRELNDNGNPLSGGKLYFYLPGASLTPKDTYSDNNLLIPNTNPVILSQGGLTPNIFLDGAYRVILQNKDGVQIYDADSVNSIVDSAFAAWDSTISYGVGGLNIVYASDGNYYVSIQSPNLGNEPSASPSYWTNLFDYIIVAQATVPAGEIAVGDATTGLTGVATTDGFLLIGDAAAGLDEVDTTALGTLAVGNATTVIALAAGNNGEILSANSAEASGLEWATLGALYNPDYEEFLSSDTYAIPASAVYVYVEAIGGGAGGAGGSTAGGGGGGGFNYGVFRAADLSGPVTVTVGAGGSAGSSSAGGAGGNSTFGAYLTARGGAAGNATSAPSASGDYVNSFVTGPPASGAGSWSSGGGAGGANSSVGGSCIKGGGGGGGTATGNANAGGASLQGGAGGASSAAGTGVAGTQPGGGGGGGGGGTGGAGGAGRVRVWSW